MSTQGEPKSVMIEEEEKIEGLGRDEDTGWGDYPIDTLLIRNEQRTVFDIVRRIEQGSFVMDPDFQRAFIWPPDKQSKLIESVLMRIPLPVFYLAEDLQGRMVVVDGLQRLTTFKRFLNNELILELPKQSELNGKSFEKLSPKLQNRVEDCNLILYIVDTKVPERARLDIFERVNGGVPLTRQQMRNCLYMGEATKFLRTEASTELFKKTTGYSLKTETMRDREFVNRFCAFQLLKLDDYKGDMDDFLARTLIYMNTLSQEQFTTLSDEFRNALMNNQFVFAEHAFRKHNPTQSRRSILNASLWDVMCTRLSRISNDRIRANTDILRARYNELMAKDYAFVESITIGPNTTKQVRYRFKAIQQMLEGIFNV